MATKAAKFKEADPVDEIIDGYTPKPPSPELLDLFDECEKAEQNAALLAQATALHVAYKRAKDLGEGVQSDSVQALRALRETERAIKARLEAREAILVALNNRKWDILEVLITNLGNVGGLGFTADDLVFVKAVRDFLVKVNAPGK